MKTYSKLLKKQMKDFYERLNEREKRRYAAIEATRYGHGGQTYISKILDCSDRTIYLGQEELDKEYVYNEDKLCEDRIRKEGGGRKGYKEINPDMDEIFLKGA